MPPFREALRLSIPVFFGYLPMGAAFGLLFVEKGFPWVFAGAFGLFLYAGSLQFLSVSLLSNSTPLIEIALAGLLLNLRHVFYGFSFTHRFPTDSLRRLECIFGLTDETYSVLSAHRLLAKEEDEQLCFWVTALNHFYWFLGCLLGGILGATIHFNSKGLEFTLTALFVVLAIEQIRRVRRYSPVLYALGAGAVALYLLPSQFLGISLGIVFVSLVIEAGGKPQ